MEEEEGGLDSLLSSFPSCTHCTCYINIQHNITQYNSLRKTGDKSNKREHLSRAYVYWQTATFMNKYLMQRGAEGWHVTWISSSDGVTGIGNSVLVLKVFHFKLSQLEHILAPFGIHFQSKMQITGASCQRIYFCLVQVFWLAIASITAHK